MQEGWRPVWRLWNLSRHKVVGGMDQDGLKIRRERILDTCGQDMLTDSWWNMRENRSQGWLPRTWRMKLLFKEMWWLNSACMCLPWKVGQWPLDQVSWGEGVDSLTSAQIHHGRGDGLTGRGEFRPTSRRQGPPWSPGHSQDEESKVVSGQAHRKLMTDWFSRSHAKFLTPENWPPAFDKGNNPFGVRLFEKTNLNWT